MAPPSVPPGSSPGTGWTGGGSPTEATNFQLCGPLGCDGPIGYEVYTDTGPSIPFGEGQFVHRLKVGWMVGAGGRSLFFNQEPGEAYAWVVDLGSGARYNRGDHYAGLTLDIRQPTDNNAAGAPVNQPDLKVNSMIRDIDRNSFNWAIGRDWWLWGPGGTGWSKDGPARRRAGGAGTAPPT